MDTVYIETSIVSYLRQRPCAQVVMAARQLLTHKWWNDERSKYDLVASQYVIDEASAGDPTLASERLESLDGVPLLPLDPAIAQVADEIDSAAESSHRPTAYRHGRSSSDAIPLCECWAYGWPDEKVLGGGILGRLILKNCYAPAY